jgi:hypothetical protein
MQYVFKNAQIVTLFVLSILSACGVSGGNAPNLFGNLKIFVTASTYTGNLGGVNGADDKCMADANYPGVGSYRALISDGTTRTTSKDWPIIAGVKYIQADTGAVIATANNSSVFTFPLSVAFKTSGSTLPYWSGLNASWVGETSLADNCQGWTSANGGFFGPIGRAEDTANTAIFDSGTNTSCNASMRLVCIEQ